MRSTIFQEWNLDSCFIDNHCELDLFYHDNRQRSFRQHSYFTVKSLGFQVLPAVPTLENSRFLISYKLAPNDDKQSFISYQQEWGVKCSRTQEIEIK